MNWVRVAGHPIYNQFIKVRTDVVAKTSFSSCRLPYSFDFRCRSGVCSRVVGVVGTMR